jgi:S-layer protein
LTSSSNATLTDIRVTQSGTNGKNSLTFVDSNSATNTVSKLTLSGDKALTIANANSHAGGLVFTSLVDGGDTNTLATIKVTGAGKTTLAAITDTALKTIDASTATGELIVGSGTAPSMVGLTVYGSTTINTITVAGANSFVEVDHAGAAGHVQTVTANGSGTTVVVTHDGTAQTSGTAYYAVTANGAGATVDTSAFVAYGSTAPTISATGSGSALTIGPGLSTAIVAATVGKSATVTLYDGQAGTYGAAYVNVILTSATAGDTTAGTYTMTTVKGAYASSDTLQFAAGAVAITFTAAPVNVAAATTLAAAIDQAATGSSLTAGDAYIKWFQFGGDTYVVENIAEATATTGIDANDIVVKLTGLVDLSGVSLSTTKLPLG